ncbi:uncharacterized protein LOC128554772 isoform X2 [Mercenaria mercenaria]|uniref:uncharacterized protein LOC128554772 isoform X2 n=1 Tax=Mercenaria mercenaria TaxID=6596 RepID=UPI00234E5F60|nr:uncharacterized protein LOC128554772 isoform X2 [Mercenaria mercenaria]
MGSRSCLGQEMAAAKLSETVSVYDDDEKWKKELEKAGFSHIDGTRPICYDCGLRPVLDNGDSPSQIHAELFGQCKFAKENILARSETVPHTPESEGTSLNARGGEILRAEALLDTEIGETPATIDGSETPLHTYTNRNDLTPTKGHITNNCDKDNHKMDETEMRMAPTPRHAISQQKPNEKRHIVATEYRKKELKAKTQCLSCCKSLRNHSMYTFKPCGHFFCSDCASDQVVCKICKQPFEQKKKTYWS